MGEDGGGFKEETAGLRGKSGYPLLEDTDQVATDDTQCCIWPSAHMPTNPVPPLQHPYSKTPTTLIPAAEDTQYCVCPSAPRVLSSTTLYTPFP